MVPDRQLTPDPQMGSRDGWAWCPVCGGIQPPEHNHGIQLCAPGGACRFSGPLIDLAARAEFAESLLCAVVFDHVRMMQGHHRIGEATCYFDCSLCEAAR